MLRIGAFRVTPDWEMLLAIDPGEATGWSTWAYSETEPLRRLDYGLIPGGAEGVMGWLEEFNGFEGLTHVVIEDWRLAGDTKNPNLEALEVIGVVRLACRWRGVPPPVRQHRSLKTQVTDEKLQEIGYWLENSEVDWVDARDVNDSAIHALTWAKLSNHLPTLEAYWAEW